MPDHNNLQMKNFAQKRQPQWGFTHNRFREIYAFPRSGLSVGDRLPDAMGRTCIVYPAFAIAGF